MLQTKTVEHDGKKYVISQAGMIHALRRVTLFKKVGELTEKEQDDDIKTALLMYPNLAACCDPQFGMDTYMQMPEVLLDKLTGVVMELNPHWFTLPGDEEKKSEQPTASTSNSETS